MGAWGVLDHESDATWDVASYVSSDVLPLHLRREQCSVHNPTYKRVRPEQVEAKVVAIKAELGNEYLDHFIMSSSARKTVDIEVVTQTAEQCRREACAFVVAHPNQAWRSAKVHARKYSSGHATKREDRDQYDSLMVGIAIMLSADPRKSSSSNGGDKEVDAGAAAWTCSGTTLMTRAMDGNRTFPRGTAKLPPGILREARAASQRMLASIEKGHNYAGWFDIPSRKRALRSLVRRFAPTLR